MLKKLMSIALVTAICASSMLVSAAVTSKDDEKQAEKMRVEIRKLGTGPDAQVELELRDKTKVKGYISEANDNDFVVVDPNTKTSTTVAYPQVRKAKGNNLSVGVKIALTLAVVAAVTFLSYKYGRRNRRYGY
jgi:V8-like Glu-specific endopeptidase